jgi:hypothetical protein
LFIFYGIGLLFLWPSLLISLYFSSLRLLYNISVDLNVRTLIWQRGGIYATKIGALKSTGQFDRMTSTCALPHGVVWNVIPENLRLWM